MKPLMLCLCLLLCGCGRLTDPVRGRPVDALSYPVEDTLRTPPFLMISARVFADSLEVRARRYGGAPLLPYSRWDVAVLPLDNSGSSYVIDEVDGWRVRDAGGNQTGRARFCGDESGFVVRIAMADMPGALIPPLGYVEITPDHRAPQLIFDQWFHAGYGNWSAPEARAVRWSPVAGWSRRTGPMTASRAPRP